MELATSTSGSSCWKETTERTLEPFGFWSNRWYGLGSCNDQLGVLLLVLCLVASCFYVQGYFTGPENSVRDGEKIGTIYLSAHRFAIPKLFTFSKI